MKNCVDRAPGFADRLKAARISCGLTQQQVADELGLQLRSYIRYERGESEPSLNTLVSISVILGVTTDSLLGLEGRAG